VENSHVINRAFKEMKLSLKGVLEHLQGESDSLDIQINEMLVDIDKTESAFVFNEHIQKFLKLRDHEINDQSEKRKESLKRSLTVLKEVDQNGVSPSQRDSIERIISSIESKEFTEHDVIEVMTEAVDRLSYDINIIRSQSSNVTQGSDHKHLKHNENDIVAADLQSASKRLGRDLYRITTAISSAFPHDDDIRSIKESAELAKEKGNSFFLILDLFGELSTKVKKTLSSATLQTQELLYDIQCKIIDVCKHSDLIQGLNNESGDATNSMQEEVLAKLDDLSRKSQNSSSVEESHENLMKSISSMKDVIETYAREQKKRNLRNRNRVASLNNDLSAASSHIKKLKAQVSTKDSELVIDELTQIGNRRGYANFIQEQHQKLKSGDINSLSIVVMDIDKFKQVNDTYGHAIGDQVLKRTASIASQALGKDDYVARFGGEEFVVVCVNKGIKEAAMLSQKIRKAIKSRRFTVRESKKSLNITLSSGVAQFANGSDIVTKVFENADSALYQAKNNGRDRTVVYFNYKFHPIKDKV